MYKYKDGKTCIILISCIAVLLWLVLIFNLSAQPATQSDGLSKKVTRVIVETVVILDHGGNPEIDLVQKFNHIVRKYAHAGVYFVLGVLMMNALRRSEMRGFKVFACSFVFCALYAVSDEVHQLFVLGRGAQVMDVLIDCSGALVGIGMYGVLKKMKKVMI
ncbi:VanZ family protein [Lutibacter sp. B2]|nr:VanZ family protein [Lutibacter sp. B2]